MKKSGLLSSLNNLKVRNEHAPQELTELTPMEIINILLTYLNDSEIRSAVDSIPF
jgi:hypothetical protein